MFITKKMALTLAEVLIVLGLIGIVAALTIPTVLSNIQDQAYQTSLKKTLSMINQAYSQVKQDNGGTIKGLCPTNDSDCLYNLFKPYFQANKVVSGIPNATNLPGCWGNAELYSPGEPNVCLNLNDGTSIVIDMEWSDCTNRCGNINIDVNGLKGPNTWGKDRYFFSIWDDRIFASSGYNCFSGQGTYSNNLGCSYKYLYNQ